MIDYKNALNKAQYAAVASTNSSILVVAGAGSGKTRTIVYRLAWLAEQGIEPNSMLLLTFTRKAAKEMLSRADQLLGHNLIGIQGGTFHSFAFHILQIWHPEWLGQRSFTLMDSGDITDAIKLCKSNLKIGVGDRSFPKTQLIASLLSKARNKELSIADVLKNDAYHLVHYADEINEINKEYIKYRRDKGLMDYDDLLFELDDLIEKNPRAADYLHNRFSHVLVDEYQDTNLVQARIIRKIAYDMHSQIVCNIMAVGDEAQSIYAFRGATVRNIIDFPKIFPSCEIIRLEENFRSTQPILDSANIILEFAQESFNKILFTKKKGGVPVTLVYPKNDELQAKTVVQQIKHLLAKYAPEEIAVLFRSGFHSYHVEMMLNKEGLPFRKYGGLKYIEAAHIKDCLAFMRLLLNPFDLPSFSRIASMHTGIGPKTVDKLYGFIREGNSKALEQGIKRSKGLTSDLAFLDELRKQSQRPAVLLAAIIEYYEPRLKERYQEDWPSRKQGLEEILQMAQTYEHVDDFIADMLLESGQDEQKDPKGHIQLSTIHSAKGLEWDAVLLIDLIEDRFPSHHALNKKEDFEEERRLMYVACTRARKELYLYSPKKIYMRQEQNYYDANPSPFVKELLENLSDDHLFISNNSSPIKYDLDQYEITEDIEYEIENEKETNIKRDDQDMQDKDVVVNQDLDAAAANIEDEIQFTSDDISQNTELRCNDFAHDLAQIIECAKNIISLQNTEEDDSAQAEKTESELAKYLDTIITLAEKNLALQNTEEDDSTQDEKIDSELANYLEKIIECAKNIIFLKNPEEDDSAQDEKISRDLTKYLDTIITLAEKNLSHKNPEENATTQDEKISRDLAKDLDTSIAGSETNNSLENTEDCDTTQNEIQDEPHTHKIHKANEQTPQYCHHNIFGRGKILKIIDGKKAEIDFRQYGIKTILLEYLTLED